MLRRGLMAGSGWPSGGTDPYFANVVSLLNFQGTHGSTTFTDELGKTWTTHGDAHIEVSGGEAYGVFDGVTDKITTPDSADFAFGTGDFCMDAIITPNSVSTDVKHIMGQFGSSPNMAVMLYLFGDEAGMSAGSAATGAYDGTFDLSSSANLFSVGVRAHVALARNGTLFTVYVDGVSVLTKTDSRSLYNSTKVFSIGANDHLSGQEYIGKIHAARVTKGVPRYTTTFTPPTWPLPSS